MKKNLLSALCLLALSGTTMAQQGSGLTQVYSLVNKEPLFRHTVLIIDPIYVCVNTGFASSLRFETELKKKGMIWGRITKTWIEGNAYSEDIEQAPVAVNGFRNLLASEIGGAYFLQNDNIDADVKVTTHVQRSMNTEITYKLKVPSEVKIILGLRGGNLTFRKQLLIDEESRILYYYRSMDGSYEVPILPKSKYVSNTRQPAGAHETVLGMSYTNSIFVGAHFRRVVNTIIMIDGARRRSTQNLQDFFADVVLPYYDRIPNVVDIKNEEWQLVTNKRNINKIGWRVGYSLREPKGNSWQLNVELGKRPGPKLGKDLVSNGLYAALGVCRSIGFGKYGDEKVKRSKKESRDD